MWDALCAGWEALTLSPTVSSPAASLQASVLAPAHVDADLSESEKVTEVKRRPRKPYGSLKRPMMSISVTAPNDNASSSSEDDLGSQANKPGYQYDRHQHRFHIGRHHTDPSTSTLTTTTTHTVPFPAHSPLDSHSLKASSSRSSTRSSLLSTSTPPPSTRKSSIQMPKTLVLDLDETLIHSTSRPFPTYSSSFFSSSRKHGGDSLFSSRSLFGPGKHRGKRGEGHVVEVMLGGRRTVYHVYKRPFVDFFLRTVSSWYTLVIFTASMQEYADPVIDWLDAGRGILAKRFFRDVSVLLFGLPLSGFLPACVLHASSYRSLNSVHSHVISIALHAFLCFSLLLLNISTLLFLRPR
jgi:hypothetical protein